MHTYIFVGVVLPLVRLVENVLEVQSRITRVMDDSSLRLVVDEHEHFEVAQDGQLHRLLQKTLLSFAISHVSQVKSPII